MGILAHNLSPQDRYKQEAKQLMKQQDQLLTQLQGLEEDLQAQGIGMNEPLIDNEGYPRSDIDVAEVRHLRNLVYRLRNDHKKVMAEIETVLHQLHQASRASQGTSVPETSNTSSNSNINVTEQQPTQPTQTMEPLQPFAKVNAVSPDSPASESGLQRNDLILQFGTITIHNHHQQLRALATIVQTHMDRPLEIKVLRHQDELTLSLTPRNDWGGRGALGCHILPL